MRVGLLTAILFGLQPCAANHCLWAQAPALQNLRVDKKNGQLSGPAIVTVNGKPKHIVEHALAAWSIMDGRNALILAAPPKRTANKFPLIYLDGATRKRRTLGMVPFSSASFKELRMPGGSWVFVLSGTVAGAEQLLVADTEGIHGRVENAVAPELAGENLTYRETRSEQQRTVSLHALLADDLTGIYRVQESSGLSYVQFLRDGRAVLLGPQTEVEAGTWWTDGSNMTAELGQAPPRMWPQPALEPVSGIPAETRLVVRLLQPLSSFKAKQGDPVNAVLISPVLVNDQILLPQGSVCSGTIVQAHGVGWALRHETAAVTANFTSIRLPDGHTEAIQATLYEVENAREKVNAKGSIEGIRSTGTLGHSAESKVASLASIDPVAYLFTTVSATTALGFAEPEILYPAGTELDLQLTAPLITSQIYQPEVTELAISADQQSALSGFVRQLSFRTATKGSNKPSDLTNLLFLGSPDAVQRAFRAAGWVASDQLNAQSTFQTLKSIGGNQLYSEAPMSTLLLDERPPIYTFSKTTNTFSSRHHIRIFDSGLRYRGARALTASSTQDIGIAFSSRQKTFIHVIDQYIDNERSKAVNDLEFTGCVTAAQLVLRAWVPQNASNSTGDELRTDGAIAVLKVNDCRAPKSTSNENAVPPARFERISRNTVLTLRNDIVRGNVGYQGVSGLLWLHKYFATRDELKPESGAWRKASVSGTNYRGFGTLSADQQPAAEIGLERPTGETHEEPETQAERSHRWDPPRYEIGLQGGYLRYPSTRYEGIGILLEPKMAGFPILEVGLLDQVYGGWTAGIYFTANTWRWFSNEFAYQYQRGRYNIGTFVYGDAAEEANIQTQSVGLITRQFEYNFIANLRRPESRWRPYVALGPALQLISISEAPLKKAPAAFRLGLQNVGVLLAAFDFGSTPPLEGGGIFQLGLQYGAGVKYRITPRLSANLDFRETWSKTPNFIKDSYTEGLFIDESYNATFSHLKSGSAFLQQRFTLGFAFNF